MNIRLSLDVLKMVKPDSDSAIMAENQIITYVESLIAYIKLLEKEKENIVTPNNSQQDKQCHPEEGQQA